MKIRLRIISMLVLMAMPFAVQPAHSQEILPLAENSLNDVQGRFRAGLELPLDRFGKWDFTWNEQVRLHNNFKDLDKIVSSVGVSLSKTIPSCLSRTRSTKGISRAGLS